MTSRFKLIGCNQPEYHRYLGFNSVTGQVEDRADATPCGLPVRAIDGNEMYCEHHYNELKKQNQPKEKDEIPF